MGLSSIIGAGINAIGNYYNTKLQAKMTKQMIASQEKMNDQNVASQEKINQQNIDFQQGINNMMRSDAQNAISIKKRDLQNAGYSTADPNQQGFANAQLGSPELTAPQVESEFNPAMAQQELDARTGLVGSLLEGAKTMSEIAVNKATARSQNANATNFEINNDYLEANLKVAYQTSLETLKNWVNRNKESELVQSKYVEDINLVKQNIDLVAQQIIAQKYNNKFAPEKFFKEMQHLSSLISNINADTDNKKVDKEIKNFEKEIMSVKANMAKMGINFESSDIVTAIARIVTSPKGHEVLSILTDFINNAIESFTGSITDHFRNPNSTIGNVFRANFVSTKLLTSGLYDVVKWLWRNKGKNDDNK